MKPAWQDNLTTIYRGEAREVMQGLPDHFIDVILTDPPYSSGGMMRGDRATAGVKEKYQQTGSAASYDEFTGDSRDQRGFMAWCGLWMEEARRLVVPGGILACFTDWRQLPTMTDALQVGGWVWRGIVPWIKPGARPCQGRWSNTCEYLVWGTNGPRKLEGPAFPGVYTYSTPPSSQREHMTQKPLALMSALLEIVGGPGHFVMDPFMGSGTTLKAARAMGINNIGVEIHHKICAKAIGKIERPDQLSL